MSFGSMIDSEQQLHTIFDSARSSLLTNEDTGPGDERFQMPFAYTEGQRAEAVWEGKNFVVEEQLVELAETARQATLYVMHDLLGWQAVPYQRYVCEVMY